MCKYRSFAAVGVDPAVMGVGPAVAIPAAVKAAGLQINDVDLFEINEVYFHLIVPLGKIYLPYDIHLSLYIGFCISVRVLRQKVES